MDRPRGRPDNPGLARRMPPVGAAHAHGNLPPHPPRRDASNSSLSASTPLSSNQVIALVRESMRVAHENEAKATEGISTLKPGLTIDLSRKRIQKLPDEVVDIIKDELERLALSHNYIQTFPARFSECTSLRYLNVRSNRIKEFPLALCDLKSLEILDLGRNMLRVLPPDIVKLSSLKVFSIQKNEVSELPLCLADMPSLSVIKLEGNPLVFPPPEVFQVPPPSVQNEGILKESELTEITVTAHVKKYLKAQANIILEREQAESPNDETDGIETPRPTIKRVFSGRFPIKVNGTDVPDLRSPNLSRPPPIPSRSHYRGLSQQSSAQRRPGVMPLTIGNPNERIRSNSETTGAHHSSRERSESRSRRMGVVSRKGSELGTLDELEAKDRFSIHYRGLSHGSAMQPGNGSMPGQSPAPSSPADSISLQRPIYVRRLSILPERRRESKFIDPVLEAAKGILYSIFQIHPMIQMLMGLANDGSSKRSSLEIVFYNTNAHVEQLELEIQKHDQAGDGTGPRENENVQRACITLVQAYSHVCSLLVNNVDLFLDNGDPRYLRTLLTQLYNSIMELRVTCSQPSPGMPSRNVPPVPHRPDLETIRPHSRDNSVTPTIDRPPQTARLRNPGPMHPHANLRVATDVPLMPYNNGMHRQVMSAVTPRSGEPFPVSAGGLRMSIDEEDRIFEKIFLALMKSAELALKVLPNLSAQFSVALRNATTQRASDHVVHCWKALIVKCNDSIRHTEILKERLSNIKLKEPGIRGQPGFWRMCNDYIDAWYVLGKKTMQFQTDIQLPVDAKSRMRPIQKAMKDAWEFMVHSPWSHFLKPQPSSGGHGRGRMRGRMGGPGMEGVEDTSSPYSTHGTNTPVPMPMTPQSAALGPAVQATVPSTPKNGSFSAAFNGGLFERAETLIQMGGPGMGSRSGTMQSTSTASLNSIGTTLSGESAMTPNSALRGSPGPGSLTPLPFRMNSGKVGF
ncbi:RAM signaling pathway protein-domain-containing protein [Neurospora tetraspora]|uniref:RAM signaling pathway protein-domain-containing protein n=1 Tax=Neurospora tetraspora TaxID=94610 RepID=A0AAE0MRQ3_9PEZI|nr:RAM signaling pathway protein-domain-containing protein [Neurospora tetraspora]